MRCPREAAFLFVMLAIAIVPGCGESAEETSSVEEIVESAAETAGEAAEAVTEAASKMSDEQRAYLEQKIEGWKELIAEKDAELKEVAEKLKGMSPQDLMGEEGKALKEQSDKLKDYISDVEEKIATASNSLVECGTEDAP